MGTVIVRWTAVDDAAFYRIGWVALDDIAAAQAAGREWLDAFIFADISGAGATEYAVPGVTPGRRYAFIVASVGRRFGAGSWSEWAYLTPAVEPGVSCPADGGRGPTPPAIGGTGTPTATPTPTPTLAPTPTLMPTPTPTLTPADAAALERAALAALYQATDGDNWGVDDHNWLSDKPLGEWRGVTTDSNGSVISLVNIGSDGIAGPAAPFSVPHSVLTGNVPAGLGSLANLRALDLSDNELTGGIPAELGRLASLQSLDLSGNQLTGGIPAELGNIPNLHFLYLGGNQLTGCLPEGLRDVPHNDLIALRLPFCGR